MSGSDKRLLVAIAELAGYKDVVCLDDPDNPGMYILVSQSFLDRES
jgi:5S rRNA maturation endonuclease (ribonuclease M5)